jgi:hypothetical protein
VDTAIADLISPAVDLRGGNQATLRFRTWYDTTERSDLLDIEVCQVAISTDNGAVWSDLAGFGYGDVKKALVAAAADFFADARRRRAELAADPGTIDAILAEGAERARSRAGDVLSRAKRACGLSRLPGKPAGGKA